MLRDPKDLGLRDRPLRGRAGETWGKGGPRERAPRARTSGRTTGSKPLARTQRSAHQDVPEDARPGPGSPATGGDGRTELWLSRIPSQAALPVLRQGQGPGRAMGGPGPLGTSTERALHGRGKNGVAAPLRGWGMGSVGPGEARCSSGFVGK